MLATILFEVTALHSGKLPVSHGRFVHAAALKLLQQTDSRLAKTEHDSGIANYFSVSMLEFPKLRPISNTYNIPEGSIGHWRITAMREDLVRAFVNVRQLAEVRIGQMDFVVTAMTCEPEIDPRSGYIAIDDFIQMVYELPPMETLTLNFVSPTVFRVNDRDYPFPLPELIFTSLAKRAEQCLGMRLPVEAIREQAQGLLLPIQWQGETRRVFCGNHGGATGFMGSYTFDLRYFDMEMQKLILLLSELGTFTGVGRLTAQGLGQLRVEYK